MGLSSGLTPLSQLLEMKSTDRKQTLLHYLVRVITEKYPELTGFHTELHFLDKAGTGSACGHQAGVRVAGGSQACPDPALLARPAVSLDSVLQDVRSLQQGMELTRKEFMRQDDSPVLKDFLKVNSEVMEKLQADSKTAKVGTGGSVGSWGRIVPLHSCKGTPRGALSPTGDAPRWAPAGGLGAGGGYGGEGEVGEAGRRWWAMGCCCLPPAPRIGVSLPAGGVRVGCGVLRGEPQDQPPHHLLPHVHALHQSLQGRRGRGVACSWGLGGIWGWGGSDPTLGKLGKARREAGGSRASSPLGSVLPSGAVAGAGAGLGRVGGCCGEEVGGLRSCSRTPLAQHLLPTPLPRKQSRTSSCGRNKRPQPKRQNLAPAATRTSPR